jgi:hypothetical protein
MVERGSCAAEDPHPSAAAGSAWGRLPAQISTTDPLGPRHVPADRLQTVPAALAAWERSNRNLRRMLARSVADHLFRAAELLRDTPSADAVVLAAAGTVEAIYALDDAARSLGGALPAGLTEAADQLPGWASILKQQHQAAAEHGRPALPRPRRRPQW